jgi:xanthine dehydrogenase accessory factor
MRELLAELTKALDDGRDCVYCAIIETRGSTPQKAGAAMLVFADGNQRGTLGGGCVEAEVKQRALRTLANDKCQPELMTFSLDDNYGWDDGLICGGRMTILADPLAVSQTNGRSKAIGAYYRLLRQFVENGSGCTEAIVMTDGSRYLFDQVNRPAAQLAGGPAPIGVAGNLSPIFNRPSPTVQHGVAYLPVLPRITLLIVGGGHVGQAVAKLAAEVDFDIVVLDDRAAYVSADRFPTARQRLLGDIGESLKQLATNDINPSMYALIVTRGHGHDEEALYHLAATCAGYVGMIGSKRKIKMIFQDLVARGVPAEVLRRVHAPLGFAIGSQTVPEIAISIVAELIACRNLGAAAPSARTPSLV